MPRKNAVERQKRLALIYKSKNSSNESPNKPLISEVDLHSQRNSLQKKIEQPEVKKRRLQVKQN